MKNWRTHRRIVSEDCTRKRKMRRYLDNLTESKGGPLELTRVEDRKIS